MAGNKELSLLSETGFAEKAPKGYPRTCPTIDLTAVWDRDGKNLLIYRPPNQTVSKIHQVAAPGQQPPEALAVTWKPDGHFLAVGWSDGVVRLMGLENNKAAHHLQICEATEATITHIGWASSTIVDQPLTALPDGLSEEISMQWSHGGQTRTLDLPRELTFVEVDTALPKISPLPSGSAGAGEDALVFTLRTGIEFLFQTPKPEDHEQVDIMVVGTSKGKLHLSIYDSFVIGSFQCPDLGTPTPLHLMEFASHPRISTQVLLLTEKMEDPDELHLVPFDLPFISSSPVNLSLLASKLTTLQKLLRYLKQTQLHMQVEWVNTRELPNRFLRSVQGDLENMDTGPRDIVSALYHLALTGHAHEPTREWLLESLAERGHKRWDKAVVSGLENIRSLVHENFLPALERCSIILSRLRGLGQFHDSRDDMGYSVPQILRIMDIISSLSLVGHKILINVMDELEYFTAFSAWLRFQIDRLASSSASEEPSEKEAFMNNGRVLTYIQCYLTESPLSIFFDDIEKADYSTDWNHLEDGASLLDVLDKQLKKREAGQASMKALPHVDFLVNYATSRAKRIFDDIAEAKRRSVRFGTSISLSLGRPIAKMDARMRTAGENAAEIFVAMAARDVDNYVYIFRSGLEIVNGISKNNPLQLCRINLGDRKYLDLKFLDEKNLMLLMTTSEDSATIVKVPIDSQQLSYGAHEVSHPDECPEVSCDGFEQLRLPENSNLRPVQMEVYEKSSLRGDTPERVCLLSSNRTKLSVFSLP